MAKATSPKIEQELNAAFESFRAALQGLLEQEANASVQRALQRMGEDGGPFSVSDAQVEVSVTGLTVAAGVPGTRNASSAPAQPKRTQKRASSAAPRKRRSSGAR